MVYDGTNVDMTDAPIVDVATTPTGLIVRVRGPFVYTFTEAPIVRLLPSGLVCELLRVSDYVDGITTLTFRRKATALVATLIDNTTGEPAPWEVLQVDIERAYRPPVRGYAGYSPIQPAEIEIILKGFVSSDKPLRPRPTIYRLEPHGIACVIVAMNPQSDGTTHVKLLEYRTPIISMPTTRNRIRYRRVGPNRFVVHGNRGPVMGHVVRTTKGYEIEGRFYNESSMKGVLKHFRVTDPVKKRDGVVSDLIENVRGKKW